MLRLCFAFKLLFFILLWSSIYLKFIPRLFLPPLKQNFIFIFVIIQIGTYLLFVILFMKRHKRLSNIPFTNDRRNSSNVFKWMEKLAFYTIFWSSHFQREISVGELMIELQARTYVMLIYLTWTFLLGYFRKKMETFALCFFFFL